MSQSPSDPTKPNKGQSAELFVAVGLLLVCAVVGLTLWLGTGDSKEDKPTVVVVQPATIAKASSSQNAEETAALEELQRSLRARLEAAEAEGRAQAEALAAAEEAKQQAEAERAAAEEAERQRREAEAELARVQAELEARRRAAAEAARAQAAAQANASSNAQDSPPAGIDTAATIDWDSCRKPEYPRVSRMRGDEGLVVLALDINPQGEVSEGRIHQSSGHKPLDEATLRALSKCRFSPATRNGQAVAMTGLIEFGWSLR